MKAALNYAVKDGVPHVHETYGPNNSLTRKTGNNERREVVIADGRTAGPFVLDEAGFELVPHATAVADLHDADQITRAYYEEAAQLVKARTGARRVVVFDHTLRTGDGDAQKAQLLRGPLQSVHNDYTPKSAQQKVRDVLPAEEAEEILSSSRRFAIVQVWRATRAPIESDPLALCHAQTVDAGDLIVSERRFPHRVGQTYVLTYNSAHRWYSFPHMRREEALVFKVFDSEPGKASITPHTAFSVPDAPADAPPRESIEVRTLALF
ncbi:hypothetical protein DIPPA_32814 [Diplonema papillatum]|nr:hypothetical protein DIPPA_32814 [Diplonema papillatum]